MGMLRKGMITAGSRAIDFEIVGRRGQGQSRRESKCNKIKKTMLEKMS